MKALFAPVVSAQYGTSILKQQNRIPKILYLAAGLLWCAGVAAYLIFGRAGQFKPLTSTRLAAAAARTLLAVSLFLLLRLALKKTPRISPKLRFRLLMALTIAAIIVFSIKTPYSPGHDAHDLSGFLELMLQRRQTDYASAYLTAYVTNRLITLIYFPLVKLFGGVQLGVRIANTLFCIGGVYFIAKSCGRLFGKMAAEFSLIISFVFFPAVLLTGPYIYLPSIFLAALAFYCYLRKEKGFRIIFFLVGGVLFTVRPMSCGFLLVFLLTQGWGSKKEKHKLLKGAGKTALALVCFILVKSAAGCALYHTGLHPYPNMDSIAAIWTLETGTRPQQEKTGTCAYVPYACDSLDDTAAKFREIWTLYQQGDVKDYPKIKQLKQEIGTAIWERTQSSILSNPSDFGNYLRYKFINHYMDVYKPYYYTVNLNSPDFGWQVYRNYQMRFFLYSNLLLLVFLIAATGVLSQGIGWLIFQKKALYTRQSRAAALVLGVCLTNLAVICLTEVGKRLLFDSLVPMMIVLCFGLQQLTCFLQKSLRRKRYGGALAGMVLAVLLCGHISQKFCLDAFRYCTVSTQNDKIVIDFNQEIQTPGYKIIKNDGEAVPLEGKRIIEIQDQESMDNFAKIELPDGEKIFVAKLRLP